MRTVVLMRSEVGDAGTFGTFTLDDGVKFASGELPWRENRTGLSSIPAGAYTCEWDLSKKHGWCYHVRNVPQRSDVEIHAANWMGDESELNPATGIAYRCELLGCIALGDSVGVLDKQKALISSKDAIGRFEKNLDRKPFQLIVHDPPPEEAAVERKIA